VSSLTDSIKAPVPNPMVVDDERDQMAIGRRYTLGLMLFGVIVGLAVALMINA
jgi:hypothetical protein